MLKEKRKICFTLLYLFHIPTTCHKCTPIFFGWCWSCIHNKHWYIKGIQLHSFPVLRILKWKFLKIGPFVLKLTWMRSNSHKVYYTLIHYGWWRLCSSFIEIVCGVQKKNQIPILEGGGGVVKKTPVDPFNEHRFSCGEYTFVRHQIWSLWPSFTKIVCLLQVIMIEMFMDWFTDSLTCGHWSIAYAHLTD